MIWANQFGIILLLNSCILTKINLNLILKRTKKKISSQGAKKESIQGNIWHSV